MAGSSSTNHVKFEGPATYRIVVRGGLEAKPYVGIAHRILGDVALEFELADAGTHFEKATEIALQSKAQLGLALAYSGMGRFRKQQGNVQQAREYLTKALEIFERLGTLIEPDRVREELAGLAEAS